MSKRFSRGWLVACILACINAYAAKQGKKVESYAMDSDAADFANYDFEDFSATKYLDSENEASVESSENARVTGTTNRNAYARLSLVPERDAEMLPAHYTGVQPPGVDHMEIRSFDSSSMSSDRKNSVVDSRMVAIGSDDASSAKKLQGSTGETEVQRNADFNKGLTVEGTKENRKLEYAEAAGKKTSHGEIDKRFKKNEDAITDERNVESHTDGRRHKDRNAAGYRNVYRQNEYKKDADFYDNDHESGRFRKHGHYDEKHVAVESDFRDTRNRAAESSNAGAAKKGSSERSRTDGQSKGRKNSSGHSGFYDKFDGFAKQGASHMIHENGDNVKKV